MICDHYLPFFYTYSGLSKYFTKLKLFSLDIIALEGSVDNVNTEATNDHAFIWVSSTKCGQDQKGFSSAYLGFIVAKKIRNSAKE